jgi:hypothetical protein
MAVSFLGTFGIFDVDGTVVPIDKTQALRLKELLPDGRNTGGYVEAIKMVRDKHNLGLREAKDFVDHYEAHHLGSRK